MARATPPYCWSKASRYDVGYAWLDLLDSILLLHKGDFWFPQFFAWYPYVHRHSFLHVQNACARAHVYELKFLGGSGGFQRKIDSAAYQSMKPACYIPVLYTLWERELVNETAWPKRHFSVLRMRIQ